MCFVGAPGFFFKNEILKKKKSKLDILFAAIGYTCACTMTLQ